MKYIQIIGYSILFFLILNGCTPDNRENRGELEEGIFEVLNEEYMFKHSNDYTKIKTLKDNRTGICYYHLRKVHGEILSPTTCPEK